MVPPSSARAADQQEKRQYQNRLTHAIDWSFSVTERSQGEDGQDYLTATQFSREKYG